MWKQQFFSFGLSMQGENIESSKIEDLSSVAFVMVHVLIITVFLS